MKTWPAEVEVVRAPGEDADAEEADACCSRTSCKRKLATLFNCKTERALTVSFLLAALVDDI